MVRESVRAALKSPLSILLLVYGAFSLFSLLRRSYGFELAPIIVETIELYRRSVSAVLDRSVGLVGFTLSTLQQDVLVLWVALGRVVSRSYVLLYRESLQPNFEYVWFHRLPFSPLTKLAQRLGHSSSAGPFSLSLVPSSLIVMFLWPLFVWTFLRNPTVSRIDRWRIHTGGTPHPSNVRETELPPVGDELKPKFSKEETAINPVYDATVVILTYVVVQLAAVGFLAAGNFALARFA